MQRKSGNLPRQRSVDSTSTTVEGFDAGTGVAERGFLRERAEQDWQRAMRLKRRVSVIMFSIDNFRACRGAAGVVCKQTVADIIAVHCRRRADFVGRMRDHEFAVLLSDASRQGARQIAEAIRKDIEAQNIKPEASDQVLTVSAGVGTMVPRPTRFVDSVLIAADAGLRQARRLGGNRVHISSTLR